MIKDVDSMELTVKWSPPEKDGGSKVTHYVVEKRDMKRMSWTTVGGHVMDTKLRVVNLMEGSEYAFRVKAVNKVGESEPLEGKDSVKMKSKYGEVFFCILELFK